MKKTRSRYRIIVIVSCISLACAFSYGNIEFSLGDSIQISSSSAAEENVQEPLPMDGSPVEFSVDSFGVLQRFTIQNAAIQFYNVRGSTAEQLRDSLNRDGPRDGRGNHHDAITWWDIHWTWPGFGTSDCDLTQPVVRMTLKMDFPQWRPVFAPPEDLMIRWNDFIRALANHERRHVEIVASHFGDVVYAIRNSTCETADASARGVIELIEIENNTFDVATYLSDDRRSVFP